MTRTAVRRNSRTADRKAGNSPFASGLLPKRVRAAQAMVAKRQQEIGDLNKLLARATDPAEQMRYTLRLLATANSRNSWLDYLADAAPKEVRAVIVP